MNLRINTARLIILLQFVYTVVIYRTLPTVIPNVYDSSGAPHRFAPRAIFWVFLLLNVGVQILLSAIARHSNAFNLPSDRTDPDRPRQTKIALEMLSYAQLFLAFFLASPTWSLAHERPEHRPLGMLPFAAAIVALLITVAIGIYRMMAPPRSA